MKLSFYGADQCVTGSCHCLEAAGKRILIDCGLQQGNDHIWVHNCDFFYGDAGSDADQVKGEILQNDGY